MAQEKALRKRQQIAKANKIMFLWIAAASVIGGFAIVGSIFLFQKLMFNEKILSEKSNTVSTLESNLGVVEELERNVRLLDINQNLIDSRASTDDRAVRAVLDALPADPNSLAFGSSLQQVFLSDIDGLTIEDGLQVESFDDASFQLDTGSVGIVEEMGEEVQILSATIGFRFEVSGSAQALTEVLERLERSIRPVHILMISVDGQGENLFMEVQGVTYYEPARTIELQEKAVRP